MSTIRPTPPKGKIACPQCGETAHRIQRTLRDRILSLFSPRKRYQCDFCNMEEFVVVEPTPRKPAKCPVEKRSHAASPSSPTRFQAQGLAGRQSY
jgi:predicted RNA-binding Zn-ribbon protein involved in translation (DUF1610 family)